MRNLRLVIRIALVVLLLAIYTPYNKAISQNESRSKEIDTVEILRYNLLYPILFDQTSAEYRALCYQAYNIASIKLKEAVKNRTSSNKPIVITDVDETMLDNSYLEAEIIKQGKSYNSKIWYEWIEMASATPVPGALEFTQLASNLGVEIFYVSNRGTKEIKKSVENLKKYNFPNADEAHCLFKESESSKEPRRELLSSKYDVVLLIGDNLNDFSNIFESKSIEDRLSATDSYKQLWGEKFIVIPNIMYGEWESALFDYKKGLTPQAKFKKLVEKIKSY